MGDGKQALGEPRSVSSEDTHCPPPALHKAEGMQIKSLSPRDAEGTWEKWKGQNEHRP